MNIDNLEWYSGIQDISDSSRYVTDISTGHGHIFGISSPRAPGPCGSVPSFAAVCNDPPGSGEWDGPSALKKHVTNLPGMARSTLQFCQHTMVLVQFETTQPISWGFLSTLVASMHLQKLARKWNKHQRFLIQPTRCSWQSIVFKVSLRHHGPAQNKCMELEGFTP